METLSLPPSVAIALSGFHPCTSIARAAPPDRRRDAAAAATDSSAPDVAAFAIAVVFRATIIEHLANSSRDPEAAACRYSDVPL